MTVVSFEIGGRSVYGVWSRAVPKWVPASLLTYLAHTELGISVRKLARHWEVHPSTISRQIARWEEQRDDLLIDKALGLVLRGLSSLPSQRANRKDEAPMQATDSLETLLPDDARFGADAKRILRRLAETGAVLAIAPNMEKGVVVRDTAAGTTTRTAVVDATLAQALALKDWIGCAGEGRVLRYKITAAGRTALGKMLAEAENRASGMAEAAEGFDISGAPRKGRKRLGSCETPLMILARRKEKDGAPFLMPRHIAAAERLREDFELAALGLPAAFDWTSVLSGEAQGDRPEEAPAFARTVAALETLGSGLGDMALRCCCQLEGLEAAEQAMGWSARSGKIVLRIALERLAAHYAQGGQGQELIG